MHGMVQQSLKNCSDVEHISAKQFRSMLWSTTATHIQEPLHWVHMEALGPADGELQTARATHPAQHTSHILHPANSLAPPAPRLIACRGG
eukprot:scaffold228848_cov17-Tisochrysis_lutea.AAC.1